MSNDYRREVRTIDSWPGPFTEDRKRSPFESDWDKTLALLDREAILLGTDVLYLCLALNESQIVADRSRPYANARPAHPGVAVVLEGTMYGTLRYATDEFSGGGRLTKVESVRHDTRHPGWQANVRAVALGLESLRKVDRYGITRSGEQYRGFAAIEAGSGSSTHMTTSDAWRVLFELVGSDWPSTDEMFRAAKAKVHPDRHGGDRTKWDEVEEAIKLVRRDGRRLAAERDVR